MPTPAIGYVTSGNLDSGRFTVSGAMKTFYDKFKDGLVTVDSPDGTKWNPAQGGNVEIETRSADGDYDAQDSRQTWIVWQKTDLEIRLPFQSLHKPHGLSRLAAQNIERRRDDQHAKPVLCFR